jgi:hypothetical protein
MSIPASNQANSRAGKPMNVGDQVTVLGTIASITGYGPTATLVVTLAGSGATAAVEAQDCGASSETL